MRARTQIQSHTHAHRCTDTYKHIHADTHAHMCMHAHMHMDVHRYRHIQMHADTHRRSINAQMHRYMHTCTQTQTDTGT